MNDKYSIGIDLGGTKVHLALVSKNGNIVKEIIDKTEISGGKRLINQLLNNSKKLIEYANKKNMSVYSIGIGSPGRVDSKNGIVLDCTPNLKNWEGTKIKEIFEKELSLPTFVDNDGNVATYGEYYLRKTEDKQDYQTLILLTIGTGLGSGIIYDQKIFRGKGHGAEIGHMIIEHNGRECNCGQKGCFEMFVSGTALELQAKKRVLKYPDSLLNKIDYKITSHDIFESYMKNDLFSIKLINEFIEGLATGLISLINIFDPDILLISGGISKQEKVFLEKTINLVKENINYHNFDPKIIKIAKTIEKAGIIGAGLLAFLGYEKGQI